MRWRAVSVFGSLLIVLIFNFFYMSEDTMVEKLKEETAQEPERDLTKERQDRCAPLVKKILDMMLDENLLLSDLQYLESVVKNQFDSLVKHIVSVHAVEIFQMTKDSLQIALKQASDELWGKDADNLTANDVERTLSAAKLNKKNKKEVAS